MSIQGCAYEMVSLLNVKLLDDHVECRKLNIAINNDGECISLFDNDAHKLTT